jgi:hypothetical protein
MDVYGKYHDNVATWKHNPKNPYENFKNNLTRRNKEIAERTPNHMQALPPVSPALRWPQQVSKHSGSTVTPADSSPTS